MQASYHSSGARGRFRRGAPGLNANARPAPARGASGDPPLTPQVSASNTAPMHVTGGQIALALFGLFFVWFAVAYLRRARQRRRELYSEPTRRGALDAGDEDDALVAEASEAEKVPGSAPAIDKRRDARGP